MKIYPWTLWMKFHEISKWNKFHPQNVRTNFMWIQKLGIMILEHILEQFFFTRQWNRLFSDNIEWQWQLVVTLHQWGSFRLLYNGGHKDLKFLALSSFSWSNNLQNSETNFCENMKLTCCKIIIIMIGYILNNFISHMTIS
jgi:hypothetical protein